MQRSCDWKGVSVGGSGHFEIVRMKWEGVGWRLVAVSVLVWVLACLGAGFVYSICIFQ